MARPDDHYPRHPGTKKGSPDTALRAARACKRGARSRQIMALSHVAAKGEAGATSDEVAMAYGWLIHSSRPRLSELRLLGLIADSGKRREGRSGRWQAVWVLSRYAPWVITNPQGNLFAGLEAA